MKKTIAILGLLAGLGSLAFANADKPVANSDYKILKPKATQSVNVPAGKVEVIEFFSFTCPHCYAFDPALKQWVEKNKQNIVFKRIPVDFGGLYSKYQKLYYALESMGKLDAMHDKVFESFHKQGKYFEKDSDIADFAKANGIDAKQLLANYYSFGVATKAKQANKLVDDYGIDGVPAVLVGGKYMTSVQLANGNENVAKVMTHLVDMVKNKRK